MAKIRIDKKTGFAYIPKDLREDGLEGDIEVISNALTLTFIKPGTSWLRVQQSLEAVLKDVELRAALEKEEEK